MIKRSGVVVLITILLAACAPAVPTAAPAPTGIVPTVPAAVPRPGEQATKPAAAAPTAAPAATAPAAPTPAAKVKRGGTLNYASTFETDSWDPVLAKATTWPIRELPVLETLLDYVLVDEASGKHELQGRLAESWEVVDPTTIVLKLRKGVKFHDGSDFNAEVAKWNLERARDHPKSAAKRLVSGVQTFEVVDPLTLRLKLKQPSALAIYNLTSATGGTGEVGTMMVSKKQFDTGGEDALGTKPAGTGPMVLTEWRRDDRAILKPWNGYWKNGVDGKPLPYLDGIVGRIINDPTVIFAEMRAGTVDVSSHISDSDYQSAKANPNLKPIVLRWANNFHVFGFNQKFPLWGDNLKLRQAAMYAVDRKSLADAVGFGLADPNEYVFWGPGSPGYDTSVPHYEFNLDKAKQLMKDAGYPDGVDTVLLSYPQPLFQKPAEILQAMWAKVGIRAKLELLEIVAARNKLKLGDFEVTAHRAVISLEPSYLARMFTCEGAANWSNYCNPEVDKCMAEAEKIYDTAQRADTYKRCQKLIYEDALIGGTHRTFSTITERKEVRGLKIQYGAIDLQETWLDK
ncbi:MAG: ABC transporter substrate-binding protein [Bacteroidetes bacterium]|nr:ABC transporter substrate-binding protein [Bacteroidota bacterium]MCL5026364.1 ABC transporter substrate-binding protein [Chloroflexota bacterium]